MQFYWLYDLASWQFAAILVVACTAFGITGVLLTRKWVRRLHKIDHSHNDIVGFFLAAITVFYGITLGLVTIGTWDTYSNVEARVSTEAQTIASIYRDVGAIDTVWRDLLRKDLRNYTRNVVDVSWPLQRQGIIPSESGKFLNDFQFHLMSINVTSMYQQIVIAEVFKQYNTLVEIRRARLDTVTAGLPPSIWALVIIGALLSITATVFSTLVVFPCICG